MLLKVALNTINQTNYLTETHYVYMYCNTSTYDSFVLLFHKIELFHVGVKPFIIVYLYQLYIIVLCFELILLISITMYCK